MDSFDQRKKSILEKEDKAAKGSWDSRVIELCNKLNSMNDYYTTSSCSGKSAVMEEKVGKDGTYYLWTSHELVTLGEIKEALQRIEAEELYKFKSESPILFVCCRNLDDAKDLFQKAVDSGFKESGIKITNKLIAVEIRSGEKVEFPIVQNFEVLVWDEFLRVLIEEVNKKRIRGWEKIENLFSALD